MEGQGECQPNEPNALVNHVENEVRVVETEQHDHPSNANVTTNDNGDSSERRGRHYRWLPRRMFGRFHIPISSFSSNDVAKEAWGCTIVILTFWLFATMILLLGFYGSYDVQLGPNCSYALGANPFFAHSIKAHVDDEGEGEGLFLYGFHKSPSLDVETTWSKIHTASIDPGYHRDWTYNLNAGSNVSIYYDVKYPSLDPLSIVIAQGREALTQWMDDPFYPNTTLSWSIVHGNGGITQNILETDVYYIAVGNMNRNAVEVYLNITIQSQLYNTTNADFECYLRNAVCSFKLKLLKPNVVVLTTPGSSQVGEENNFYVEISFGTQWLTYCSATCIVTAIILAMFSCCDNPQADITYNSGNQASENVTEPLISPKSSSKGSSYDSASNDEDDIEDTITIDKGANSKIDSLCAICFDAPKDCFFLPCGHSAACFTCGSRIAEEAGCCPICRRKMKKVRKIFLV